MKPPPTSLSDRRPAHVRHDLPRLVSIEEVAKHLGVSIRHVRRLVFERRIPYVKWGHLLRFDIDDVNYWGARSTVEAINDTALSFRQ